MFTAIREGPSPYTAAQRAAWMTKANSGPAWATRLSQSQVFVTEDDGQITGFMTVDASGYIDLAYILPIARGQGRFALLLTAIADYARAEDMAKLWTHASLMAEPAFASHGFVVTQREIVVRDGEELRRAAMSKSLLPKSGAG